MAADQLALMHLRAGAHGGFEGLLGGTAALVGQRHQHQQGKAGGDFLHVDDGAVAANHAASLQLAHALKTRARGEVNQRRKLFEGDTAVNAQHIDDGFVDAVQGREWNVLGVHALGLLCRRGMDKIGGKGPLCSSPRSIHQAQAESALGLARISTTRGCSSAYRSFGFSSAGTSAMSWPMFMARALSST
ncbi:hypothetical protein D3C76_1086360 [compost metagenome]